MKIGAHRDADDPRVAAFVASGDVEPRERSIVDAEVERRGRGNDPVAEPRARLVGVVVAVVFGLERQSLDRREILDAAEQGGARAREVVAGIELSAAAGVGVAVIKSARQERQRVLDITAGAEIPPADTKREIEVEEPFAGDRVLTVEQAGPDTVLKADGDGRPVLALAPKLELEIGAAVLKGIATQGDLGQIGVAEGALEPGQRL